MYVATHVFNVGARVDGDNVTVLDSEVVANDTVDACAAIVEVVVGKNDQDRVLALLALDKDSVTTEELESLHGVVGKGDNRVVIVGGVGDTVTWSVEGALTSSDADGSYINELGFFFFLRIAVDTSFSTLGMS